MAIHAAFPPPPDSLARIAKSADGDILASKMVSPNRNRGRGAQSNLSGRFEVFQNESFDDGWQSLETLADFKTNVREERAKSIITKNESPDLNFDRSINPYRGCEHGCSYCFARQTHAYLGHSAGIDFERELYAKTNAAARLREELSRKKYTPKPIAIGTNTDPYQPIERERKIMREILEVLIEFKHPVTIVTKSALVVRDLDLLTELAEQNLVHVAMSITTLDRKLCRELEPRASTPSKRLEAVELLSQSGIPTMVMAAPIIPAINDSELEKILDAAAAQGATAAGMIMLRLPGEVRNIFREWLLRFYPDKLRHVLNLVRDVRGGRNNDPRFGSRMSGQGPYAYALQRRFELAMNRNGLKKRLPHLRTDLFTQPEVPEDQLSLF
ncbi:PA0069 family radical SAM protein [Maritalea porphyrae]|uniref:PA0069 family radical SAM protein n=1 Tax=Maritalea porphyrae TaxID=880732 RepID=UPI0022B07264|nr:PA0069 family radical SAM protein [Maritalea porphyrae]MCZ4271357.1 PA0069 family radical SAM protein [Maritalea porphyrae]